RPFRSTNTDRSLTVSRRREHTSTFGIARRRHMTSKSFNGRMATFGMAAIFLASLVIMTAGQTAARPPAIDNDDIGGVVASARGPEAGVWGIAETRSTPTRLIRSVVTDDQGRFVVPDLPGGDYDVWVRGYGLVDSAKVKARPGQTLTLTAMTAP